MASTVSEMTLLGYEDNPNILSYGSTTSAPTSSGSSLYDNINNYLVNSGNALNNFNNEINPFNIANNLLVQPIVNNPYVVGFDNMFYSLPGINSIYNALEPNSSLGLGGTVIPNSPSQPDNTPTELAKTAGTAADNAVSGAAAAAEAGINAAIAQALKNAFPKLPLPKWNWSLIILGIVALIIIMVIMK